MADPAKQSCFESFLVHESLICERSLRITASSLQKKLKLQKEAGEVTLPLADAGGDSDDEEETKMIFLNVPSTVSHPLLAN